MIERQRRKRRGHVHPAGDDGKLLRREVLGHQFGQQLRRVRRVLAGLEQHAVARRQRGGRRPQGQLQRVVPGADDAHHAQRLAQHVGARGQQVQGGAHAARAAPARQVAAQIRQHAVEHQCVGQLRQASAAQAEVLPHGLRQPAFVVAPHRRQALQAALPQGQRHVDLAPRGLLLALEQVHQAGGGGDGDQGVGAGVHGGLLCGLTAASFG